jgi:hypothetical protein
MRVSSARSHVLLREGFQGRQKVVFFRPEGMPFRHDLLDALQQPAKAVPHQSLHISIPRTSRERSLGRRRRLRVSPTFSTREPIHHRSVPRGYERSNWPPKHKMFLLTKLALTMCVSDSSCGAPSGKRGHMHYEIKSRCCRSLLYHSDRLYCGRLPSSGLWRRVCSVRTDVSDGRVAARY